MIRSLNIVSFGSAALLLLAACSPAKSVYYEKPQLVASPDKASMMLADAADRASTALETLAAIEQARKPGVTVEPIRDAPIELRRAITVNWTGPVEPLTRKLADRASYRFETIGDAPAVPIVVSLEVENIPVIDVLRSVGLQMGTLADLKVDAQNKVVEIRYRAKHEQQNEHIEKEPMPGAVSREDLS